jgi:ketosteroid isomerase-like protein
MTSEVIDAPTFDAQDGHMKTLAALALLASACVGSAPAAPAAAPQSQSTDPAVVDAVKQVAQDMGNAMVASDVDKLDRIYADDFATVGISGQFITKRTLLSDFASFHDKLLSFELGPMDVQVFGHVAVSQGTVREKRVRDGKDTSGQFAWMDLLENRAGRWVVVRSAGARLSADSSEPPSQDPAAVDAIIQLSKHTGDAMVAFDVDTLSQIYADDWVSVGSTGNVVTKESLLGDFSTRRHTLVSFALGPMKVQVLGDVAMAQASVTEKRIQDGKDISGQFVFMDLLERRAGKWVIVRTLGARVS